MVRVIDPDADPIRCLLVPEADDLVPELAPQRIEPGGPDESDADPERGDRGPGVREVEPVARWDEPGDGAGRHAWSLGAPGRPAPRPRRVGIARQAERATGVSRPAFAWSQVRPRCQTRS